eukprot:5130547-Amphidinium_carterae.1
MEIDHEVHTQYLNWGRCFSLWRLCYQNHRNGKKTPHKPEQNEQCEELLLPVVERVFLRSSVALRMRCPRSSAKHQPALAPLWGRGW